MTGIQSAQSAEKHLPLAPDKGYSSDPRQPQHHNRRNPMGDQKGKKEKAKLQKQHDAKNAKAQQQKLSKLPQSKKP